MTLQPYIQKLIQHAAVAFGVSEQDILADRRDTTSVRARHFAMFTARVLTGASYPRLGEVFKRNHSVVIQGVRKGASDVVGDYECRLRFLKLVALIVAPGTKAVVYSDERPAANTPTAKPKQTVAQSQVPPGNNDDLVGTMRREFAMRDARYLEALRLHHPERQIA